ncbi:alpha/beta hydrolase [Fibrisoma montanum]|uniref:Alpha/beta hydrolase n=1 Tax=Fibrisoma montanum TaxID=2305895 RepID=A0A418MAX1_9BACT|nr:alpha/beta hydrolase [Fibrisoma montanum]RIV23525.1 alpha/beta hydrolase [Fibrisoma montanum]
MEANQKPTIVFVHGLWADGSSWNAVIEPLQDAGYTVVSVQNPTTSFDDDVTATRRALARIEGPVVLVGHSWGGFVITEAGNDPRVKALVYVAAFAPDAGESLIDLLSKVPQNALGSHFDVADGFIKLTFEGVQQSFAGDLSEPEQRLIFATQTPASETVFGAKNTTQAWKDRPSFYIVAGQDGAIPPDLERMMASHIGAKTIEIDSSHVPMISQPEEVLDVILEAAEIE